MKYSTNENNFYCFSPKSVATLIVCIFCFGNILGQSSEIYSESGTISLVAPTSVSIPAFSDAWERKSQSVFSISLKNNNDVKIAEFEVDVLAGSEKVFSEKCKLEVSEENPLAIYILDFNRIPSSVNATKIEVRPVRMKTALDGLEYKLAVRFGFNLQNSSEEIVSLVDDQDNFSGLFKWQSTLDLKQYEFQILRLYNKAPENNVNEKSILCDVDWSKATTLLVEYMHDVPTGMAPYIKNLNLQICEGTGYYAWRVRPISFFHEGEFANHLNYGKWCDNDLPAELTLSEGEIFSNVFYYVDPQEDKNYIYSRVFTEQSGVKESVTYANSLQQSRQTVTYLPSKDVSIVTHNVLDHTGRSVLNSLPFPVSGKSLNYQEKALVDENDELYGAAHFDANDNYLSPAKASVKENYYDGTNGENVPSAEGYPYSRVVYANDGSGRVTEQGGVGDKHRIGSGNTVRYAYTTATEEEMKALFGNDAPCRECVVKILATDANNVTTITYKNKDGNVIATGLGFEDGILLNEKFPNNKIDLSVENIVSDNVLQNGRFLSSKEIVLTSPSKIEIGYSISNKLIESMCTQVTLGCDYKVIISVMKMEPDGTKTPVYLLGSNDSLKGALEFSVKELAVNGGVRKIPAVSVELEEGTYLVVKDLRSGEDRMAIETNNQNNISGQVNPISEGIIGLRLADVKTEDELKVYYKLLENLRDAINSRSGLEPFTNDHAFLALYSENIDDYSMLLDGDSNTGINNVFLSTPCCDNIRIPIQWNPPFKCLECSELFNPALNVSDGPDFEGYALRVLKTCGKITNGSTDDSFFYGKDKYMDGWQKGQFNEMVYNMLKEVRREAESKGWGKEVLCADADKDGICEEYAKFDYSCNKLFTCWQTVVNSVLSESCDGAGVNRKDDVSSKTVDDREGAPSHDETLNKPFKKMFFLARWIIKRKVSKKIRRKSKRTIDFGQTRIVNLPQQFLDCAGYRFAKILTPLDALPCPEDIFPELNKSQLGTDVESYFISNSKTTDPIPFESKSFGYTTIYENGTEKVLVAIGSNFSSQRKEDGSHYYVPLKDWGPYSKEEEAYLFPNVRNPFFAYKYFHYDGYGKNPSTEDAICMTDPNDCNIKESGGGRYLVDKTYDGSTFLRYEFKYVPCCLNEGTYVQNYSDGQYVDVVANPLCERIEKYPATGGVKYVVRNFCGVGTVKCPMRYYDWLPEQRKNFYEMIRFPMTDADEDSYGSPNTVDVFNCDDYNQLGLWYQLRELGDSESENDEVVSYVNSLPQYVKKGEWAKTGEMYYEDVDADANNAGKPYALIQRFMKEQESVCVSSCEEKRDLFKARLIQVLNDNCYEIGGCADNDNSIPEEDIDLLVEKLVLACQDQCVLNTFGCDQKECRDPEKPKTETGSSQIGVRIQYGMGGSPSDGGTPVDLDGNGSPDAYRFDLESTSALSWLQYTLINQASTWDFELNIECKCGADKCDKVVDVKENTNVDRSLYEKYPNSMPVSSEMQTPVESPFKNVQITVNP